MAFSGTLSGVLGYSAQSQTSPDFSLVRLGVPGRDSRMPWEGSEHHPGHIFNGNIYIPIGDPSSQLWYCRRTKGAESHHVWKSEPVFVIHMLCSQPPSHWWTFMATTLSASKPATHTTGRLIRVSPIPVRFPLQCPKEALVGADRGPISK